uniref:Uncharacterized protein n=1 Tax=Euplotes crassus TaxID=5936 RepID=A0A7S3KFV3_EUPCR|mmetsp:Transcript_25434/g.25193  ORF Transcript_25434/g.25193 Transcript_25434/m.25193 type:complete len:821 (+) Transcript_25434:238-2700(+)
MKDFQKEFGDMEVFINEGGDKDIDRPIRMGKGRSRLDQLEKKKNSKGAKIASISADEFQNQFKKLKRKMTQFWTKEDKVACLKICIQCAKLLNDTETPAFYPQKFLIITEILDDFGNMVFERMKKLSLQHQGVENWQNVIDNEIDFRSTPDFVKQKTNNWFLKCACIREVLPRVYLELTLVGSRRFLNKRMSVSDLDRLALMVRGIAEPLSASYTCMYLARWGETIDPNAKNYLFTMIEAMYKHWNYAAEYGNPYLDTDKYFKLFEPAIDWLFYCAGQNANEKMYKKSIKMYNKNTKKAIYLSSIILHFPADFTCKFAEDILEEIKKFELDDRINLLGCLGKALIKSKPRRSEMKLTFLNYSWEQLIQTTDSLLFMRVSIVLAEFAIKNMKSESVNTFISEIFKKFRDYIKVGDDEELYQCLEQLILIIMKTAKDFSEIIGLENFMSLLNYFSSGIKLRLCEIMVDYYLKQDDVFSDSYCMHTVLTIAKVLHDKIDSMSDKKEIERLSEKICTLIKKIDFGRDLEKMLKVFTDARGMFTNLDEVTQYLIYAVLRLAVQANKITKGKHNKKTMAFVKACIAYAHITIPSLFDSKDQIKLFMLTAEVGLMNGLISETDSIIKAILLILNAQYKNNQDLEAEAKMTEHLLNVIGFLVVMPSNPENHFEATYVIMNLIEKKVWNNKSVLNKVKILVALFNYLSTQAQDKLPYNINRVDSNDSIFLGDPTFTAGLEECLVRVFDQIVNVMTELNSATDRESQAMLSQSMTHASTCLAQNLVLSENISKFISKCIKKAEKSYVKSQRFISNAFLERTKKYIAKKSS